MVEVGIHSIKKWDVIQENCACFAEFFLFLECLAAWVSNGTNNDNNNNNNTLLPLLGLFKDNEKNNLN